MGLILKAGGDFKLAPAGQHNAVCVDVIDKGLVTVEWQGRKKQQHKCMIVWEISELMDNGQRYTVRRQFTASLNQKASLREFLEAWRGRPFTEEELSGFDTEQLVGVPALIQVVHAAKGDRTYDNVQAIMYPPKGTAKLAPSGQYVRVKDRPTEQQHGDDEFPAALRDDDDGLPF